MPHLVAILINLSQNYSYYIRGDRSLLTLWSYTHSQCYVSELVFIRRLTHIMRQSIRERLAGQRFVNRPITSVLR